MSLSMEDVEAWAGSAGAFQSYVLYENGMAAISN